MFDPEGRTVLYVGPDETARDRAVAAFEGEGLRVNTATTAKAALGGIRGRGVHCVVTEHRLPDADGIDLLRGVRQIAPAVPVVLFDDAAEARASAAAFDVTAAVPRAAGYDRVAERVAAAAEATPEGPDDPDRAIPEALKERALDEAPVGITISDPSLPDNPLVYVNDAYVEMTGYEPDEVLGRNCRLLQGDRTDESRVAEMAAAVAEEQPVSVELRNYTKEGVEFWNRVDIAPIEADGEVTNFVGFQTDVTERKRAERRAERHAEAADRERERLEGLVDRIEGLLRDVTTTTVRAESRTEMEREVCDCLAATDRYVAAWIGEVDLARNRVVSRTSAGDDADRFVEFGVNLDNASDPTAGAVRGERPRAVSRADGPFHPGRDAATPDSANAVAAVPLQYGEAMYGVLNVYASDAEAFDERETLVLESLGRTIASAIARFESRRALASDTVTELTVTFADTANPFVKLAVDADCRLEYEGGFLESEGRWLTYFSATDGTPDHLVSVAAEHPAVDEVNCLSADDEGGVFEFAVTDATLVATLADGGAQTTAFTAKPDGRARLRLVVADREAARDVVETLSSVYDRTELVATEESRRPSETSREFRSSVVETLTDRQRMALQKAYLGGFFEWPHEVSGDELAESMGISRSTFHQHLRAAERKVAAELFDGRPD